MIQIINGGFCGIIVVVTVVMMMIHAHLLVCGY